MYKMSNDNFLKEYKRRVNMEAEYILREIRETADIHDFERVVFVEDVIRKLNTIKKEVEE